MPHNLVFIGIDFLLPNRAYTNFELKYIAKLTCIYRHAFIVNLKYTSPAILPCSFKYSDSVSVECPFFNKNLG
jgi:hypothetical protein